MRADSRMHSPASDGSLNPGKPTYVRQESTRPFEAVTLGRELVGIVVLAHSVELDRQFAPLADLIPGDVR